MRPPPTAFILLSLFVSACGGAGDDGPIAVSVIGRQPELVDPNRQALSAPSAALLLATAQGLVRFDGDGQIEPGLAIRWAVSDDGLYYTFRLPDDAAINAEKVARLLRAMIAPGSQNPVKPLLGTVDEIVAVTPEVVEIRLHAPQPRLLELFAQPEMALVTNGSGTGPFAIAIRDRGALVLNLMRPEQEAVDAEEDGRSDRLRLRGERAARAIARFQVGNARLVTGGSFADLPIVQVARPPAAALRFDPVHGLFGLAVVEREGFLGNVDHRRALAMALDRDRIAAAFATPAWRTALTLLPSGGTELATPAAPASVDVSLPLRRQMAARLIAEAQERPRLRVALPSGPGARILFMRLRSDWKAIGVDVERVPLEADADLRLIDEVAPIDSAAWYLGRFTCAANPVCSETADIAIEAARTAPSIEARMRLFADADARLAEAVPYIPIAQPLRWSLVAPRLDGFRENARGIHPLPHLGRAGR
jgi:peptide/nickel transport system substrate-binding protein